MKYDASREEGRGDFSSGAPQNKIIRVYDNFDARKLVRWILAICMTMRGRDALKRVV